MVEFVSYTGKYPNLCSGELTLRIDGKLVKFGRNSKYQDFWCSGGYITRDYEVYQDKWEINTAELPEEYLKYLKEIEKVFNDNVPYGCCGGCI